MSSFYEDASLVMIPSGYKTSKVYCAKPTDGAGDLTFTRSNDTATRVNSAGLIEKVRTNLLLQSNTFTNAAWFTSGATITAGQPDPFGGNNAFLVDFSGATTDAVSQNVSMVSGAPYTLSVWIKGVDLTALRFNVGANLVVVTSQITNGTWVRVSASATAGSTASLINGIRAGNSLGESFFIYGAQLETGDIATDYIATTSAAVSVGPVANVPRLDYLNSSCPRLLLEPQRTNLALWSEQFNNAAWVATSTTVTANTTISPDGYQNADTMTILDSNSRVVQVASLGAGTYTISAYVKVLSTTTAGTMRFAPVVDGSNANSFFTPTTEWARYTQTFTAATGVTAIALRGAAGGFVGNVAVYGFQIELGSYATSYIPTLGAAVTRGADNTSLNPATLLGATVGSWYSEIDDITFETIVTSVPTNFIGDDSANLLGYEARGGTTKLIHFVKEESNAVTTLYSFTPTGKHKACFVWSGTSLKLFVDGVKRYDAGSFVQPAAWDQFQYNFSGREAQQYLNQTLLFPTALSDADAIALTA
jgi:hypothetical protein